MENPKFGSVKHDPFILDVTEGSSKNVPAEANHTGKFRAMIARAMPCRDCSLKINGRGKP
jgi:hypothetical protein